MPSSEWAAWVQAAAVVIALFIPLILHLKKRCASREAVHAYSRILEERLPDLRRASDILRSAGSCVYQGSPTKCVDEALLKFKYFNNSSKNILEPLAFISPILFIALNEAFNQLSIREEIIAGLKDQDDFVSNKNGAIMFADVQAKRLDHAIDNFMAVIKEVRTL